MRDLASQDEGNMSIYVQWVEKASYLYVSLEKYG